MSLTHSILTGYKTNAGTIVSVEKAYTDDYDITVDHAVPASTTNHEIDVVVTNANITCMVLNSDQTVTFKTNSTGAPSDNFTIQAKQAIVWAPDHLESCPLSTNLTKIFITNSNTSAANFKARFLLDQVP